MNILREHNERDIYINYKKIKIIGIRKYKWSLCRYDNIFIATLQQIVSSHCGSIFVTITTALHVYSSESVFIELS